MVQDGEMYKDEDMKLRKKIDAKNSLENYCFQMKNSINDEKLREKISDEDKKVIEDSCAVGIQYLESNQDASLEEYEAKK
jgi:L1 cell adhesion molecule like protein